MIFKKNTELEHMRAAGNYAGFRKAMTWLLFYIPLILAVCSSILPVYYIIAGARLAGALYALTNLAIYVIFCVVVAIVCRLVERFVQIIIDIPDKKHPISNN